MIPLHWAVYALFLIAQMATARFTGQDRRSGLRAHDSVRAKQANEPFKLSEPVRQNPAEAVRRGAGRGAKRANKRRKEESSVTADAPVHSQRSRRNVKKMDACI